MGSHTLTTFTMTRTLGLALLGITFAILLHFSTSRSQITYKYYNDGTTIIIRDGRKYLVSENGDYLEDPYVPVPVGDRPIEDYEGVKYRIENEKIYEVAVTVMPGKKKKYEIEYHVEVGDMPKLGVRVGGRRL